jgi:L-alanine-DL-glutamate epimerase-like enolase superfamily enzyme
MPTPITALEVSAYEIPTDAPESDGTLAWDSTTMVLVEAAAGGKRGIGWTYSHRAAATLIAEKLADQVLGKDALAIPECWFAMVHSIRNLGRPGISSMAIAAVDIALWDLKAKLLDLPLVALLGALRPAAPIYGSGGFTSYTTERLREQLGGWVEAGIPRVKMKIGREPDADLGRIGAAREAIGAEAELFVDANGAYSRKQALEKARAFPDLGVSWYEEPVSSDDLEGLHLVRNRAPGGVDITAGEYGFDLPYFRHLLEAQAVDVMQADATRCAGITGFMSVGSLCAAYNVPFSAHCAPALHMHPSCAAPGLRHIEYFHDHARIERMLFDGVIEPRNGALEPNLSRPGLGLEFKRGDARKYAL